MYFKFVYCELHSTEKLNISNEYFIVTPNYTL